MSLLLITILSLCTIGVVAAVMLYGVATKFYVEEDPRIDRVEEILPAANCGGCGFPGCRAFAEATVNAEDLDTLNCPVGGAETMASVAEILGKSVEAKSKKVAVLLCNGACDHRPKTNFYDGATSCSVASLTYGGDTACEYGCLGMGECVDACNFGAMYMDEITGLPVVIEDKCTACNACVKACPKSLLELRNAGPRNRRIYVACKSQEKGGVARKACSSACIGCSLCFKECKFDAITMGNNLAYIDYEKCVLCRKCVGVCPTNAIHEVNFPPRKPKVDKKPIKETETDAKERKREPISIAKEKPSVTKERDMSVKEDGGATKLEIIVEKKKESSSMEAKKEINKKEEE